MDAYVLLKFIHVVAAMLWVGGGLTFLALSAVLGRDIAGQMALVRIMGRLGAVMMPASLAVLLSGGVLVWLGEWGFEAWVAVALVSAGASFVLGGAVLKPALDRALPLVEAGDASGLASATPALWRAGRIEQGLHIVTVAMMVIKPEWADLHLIVAFVALVAAAVIFSGRRGRPALV
ncbi:DUF2269 family protein [Pseudoroseicyclus tamaricis]|uniref:DUF2269 family protein n=1 Tax=Pseudoroseicyclus tamaricis TaxID=2705421 RepID=A0A6B2JW84_9RHOB|nr:DUF2269 family protein [Pseudoroseicyclus tamaricis]NDV02165.1 DUF2269 family protein [Pseudoroseicyclus tamaricis]